MKKQTHLTYIKKALYFLPGIIIFFLLFTKNLFVLPIFIMFLCWIAHYIGEYIAKFEHSEVYTKVLYTDGREEYKKIKDHSLEKNKFLQMYSACFFISLIIIALFLGLQVDKHLPISQEIISCEDAVPAFESCTGDCSGHKAGFEWACENFQKSLVNSCQGYSQSFKEGCLNFRERYIHNDSLYYLKYK